MKTRILFKIVAMFAGLSLFACQMESLYEQSDGTIVEIRQRDADCEIIWEWIIELGKYEGFTSLHPNVLRAEDSEGQYYIIDLDTNTTVPIELNEMYKFYDDISIHKDNENFRFINTDGSYLSKEVFEDAYGFEDGFAAVKQNGSWDFIDMKGERLTNSCFDNVKSFKEDRAAVERNGKWGYIDTSGEVVIDHQFYNVNDFYEGYAGVMIDNKWGFIDKEGCKRIDYMYDQVGNFSEGKVSVKIENSMGTGFDEWAYVDKNNNIIIDFYPYDASEGRMIWVGEFKNGIAFVSKTLYSIIDENGNNVFYGAGSAFFISSMTYNEKHDAIAAYIFTDKEMKEKKYGLVGLNGKQRIEPIFDFATLLYDDFVLVEIIVDDVYKKGIIRLLDVT